MPSLMGSDGYPRDVEPVLLVPLLQTHVVRAGLGVAEDLLQRRLELGGAVGRPDHRGRRPGAAAGGRRRGTAAGRARRWPRGPGSRARCRRRAAPGRRCRRRPRPPPPRCRRPPRWRARRRAAPGPCGIVPSRIQSTSACSISTTLQRSTRRSASTSASCSRAQPADQHVARVVVRARARRRPAPARWWSPGCPSRTRRWPAAPAPSATPLAALPQHQLAALGLGPAISTYSMAPPANAPDVIRMGQPLAPSV